MKGKGKHDVLGKMEMSEEGRRSNITAQVKWSLSVCVLVG